MRVLHVTDCYLPRLGGIETHVSDLVAHQRRLGHDARVVTLTAPGNDADPPWVHRVGGRPDDASRSVLRADAALKVLLEGWTPDTVHVHVSVFSPFATLAARRTTSAGLPTLVTVHSLWSRLGPIPALSQALLQLRRWPLQWSAVSEAAARPLRQVLGPDVEVAVLPNAIDPARFAPAAPLAPAVDRPVTLISVMRFTRTKRAMPLARMLREVRRTVPAATDLRAVVVGDGPVRPAFERYLRRHGLDSWVEVPGRLERTEVAARLADADVFVAPADLESFGIAPLEARALGLPVVGSRRSGLTEYVRDGREGLLAGDDVEMVAAIARLVTDPTLRDTIAHHNRTCPVEHDWPTACARTDRLYARAAARVGALPRALPRAG